MPLGRRWTPAATTAGCSLAPCGGRIRRRCSRPATARWTGYGEEGPLATAIAEIAHGSFKRREPPQIVGSGYVVKSLEAALWAFHKSNDFGEGALLAANLGNDADTTAAIYGQLAGAHFGVEGIPAEWRAKLAMAEEITALADALYEQSGLVA